MEEDHPLNPAEPKNEPCALVNPDLWVHFCQLNPGPKSVDTWTEEAVIHWLDHNEPVYIIYEDELEDFAAETAERKAEEAAYEAEKRLYEDRHEGNALAFFHRGSDAVN